MLSKYSLRQVKGIFTDFHTWVRCKNIPSFFDDDEEEERIMGTISKCVHHLKLLGSSQLETEFDVTT
eukprot:snap_masked-scaffold_12-processed-gene-9.36-mRNA-1 protein AED:1.00 eAED:1.00 QI:0/0/0/0/1/1/2/0/66